ncbi:GntR family transcriptional regulator [Vreelandella alkaliphila]|uniref:GntR family transcriptional regulator n=1 Tax=Halomonas campaniensis TaxID=213554 RepID=A0A3D0KCR4_9GAMM|nr:MULTISPECIES: GntR family transcriptional regulator [unclassified Halomonas]ASK19844.1 GntR family transcriptional regulator [Halomonas sp. N3-2A]UTD53640.1 GntR family transcriptional regulator [Halomonas sp. MS1]HBS82113.1 GntR family transcriptional regulator [Halomonas campaniensis]HCA01293.1 GntR family transcriptional regulator [Halomonas campaniensis]
MASSPVAPGGFIQQQNLVEQVADYLTQAIIQQHFLPGERLSEVQLSRDLGVSRAPVREAARLLESRGLLISKPRRGFFVRALNAVELEDVFDLRLCLERHAIQRLSERYSSDAERALKQQVEILCDAAVSNDGTRRIEEDLQFHRLMIHHAGNERLLRAFDGLTHELRLCITLITKTHEAPDTIATSHFKLLDALGSGSSEACREAIDYHIGVARDFVVNSVGE